MKLRITNHISRFTLHFLLSVFIIACNSPIATPTPTPLSFAQVAIEKPNTDLTSTPFQPSDSTDTPIPTFTISPTITSTPTLTLTSPPPTVTSDSALPTSSAPTNSSRTNYILYATLNFANKTIAVDQTIRYYNNTGINLSELVLAVPPNLYNRAFSLNTITQDNTTISSYNLSGQRLTLNLPQTLPANSATTIVMNFSLNIPQKSSNDVFGYDFNQINLVDWYPFVVPYKNGWVLHDSMPWGENLVYDSSDIELNIKTDSGVTLAVGASPESNGEWTRYRLYGARTLALSASNEFLVHETSAGNIVIRSYYFAGGYKSGAEGVALYSSQAINTFSQQFGPYPHQALTIVQTDMDDGMEYDGLIFLSTDFYSQYNGTARSNLATIGIHEVAHQWWYSLVGSDHAMEPWLDEALSTYSERIFYENNYPANISWWWQFRVNYFNPSGYVDTNIYNGQSFRLYTNAVYFQGALFLDELRERMGYGNFSKFLQEYVRRYSYKHATGADFFALQREIVNVNISDLLSRYFLSSY
ncbi:MAG TPA: hypothetical protein DEP19_09355 [Anaerolineae bacterium]|nr:hypothetical protein [Anaerolineae bacterium]